SMPLPTNIYIECVATISLFFFFFFFQAEDGIRDRTVTGVQTCALPIWLFRPRCGAALPRLPAQLPQRAAARDIAARRGPVHGRARRYLWRAAAVAVSAVLAQGRARGAARRIEPAGARLARQERRHRRFPRAAGA